MTWHFSPFIALGHCVKSIIVFPDPSTENPFLFCNVFEMLKHFEINSFFDFSFDFMVS